VVGSEMCKRDTSLIIPSHWNNLGTILDEITGEREKC